MRKKIVKLSIPGLGENASLAQYLDNSNPLLNEWEIHLNNPDVRTADMWFVMEDIDLKDHQCLIDKRNVYFLAAETAQNLGHIENSATMKEFMNQFGKVFTFHQYFGKNVTSSPPFLPWMVNSNHGTSIFRPHARDVEYFDGQNSLDKSKLLSVICSTQSLTPAHQMRLNFVRRLKSHFGSQIDWYGNGVNPVEEKWDALAPYRFTIVLENQSRHNVITEKLGDSFLALSYPLYWGAPNASEYFNENSFTSINIEDFAGTINSIEEVINSDYSKKLPFLAESKSRVIHEFNFLNRILDICNQNIIWSECESITLRPTLYFTPKLGNSLNSNKRRFIGTMEGFDNRANTNFLDIFKDFYILLRYNNLTQFFLRFLRDN